LKRTIEKMKIVPHAEGERILQELSKMGSQSLHRDRIWEEAYQVRLVTGVFGAPFMGFVGVSFVFILIGIYNLLSSICGHIKNTLFRKGVETV